nr:hypothetical protein [Ningiella sp. W23]
MKTLSHKATMNLQKVHSKQLKKKKAAVAAAIARAKAKKQQKEGNDQS